MTWCRVRAPLSKLAQAESERCGLSSAFTGLFRCCTRHRSNRGTKRHNNVPPTKVGAAQGFFFVEDRARGQPGPQVHMRKPLTAQLAKSLVPHGNR
jgi:hypothetical protein